MKVSALLAFLCLAMPLNAIAQVSVRVIEPADGSNQISPVTVSATEYSPNGASGWDVYVDNSLALHNTDISGRLNSTFTTPSGTHNVVIKARDNSGAYSSVNRTISVSESPFPAPPSNAIVLQGLQQSTGFSDTWKICDSGCSGSGATATGTSRLRFNITNPTLSGSAMELLSSSTTPGSYWNTLGYRHLGCPSDGCAVRTHFLEDMWFYIPTADDALQGTEYDPGVFLPRSAFFASMQCDSATGYWRFWNPTAVDPKFRWTIHNTDGNPIPTYKCSVLNQKGIWHHYQLYVTMDFNAYTVTYQSFVVDGSIVYQNIANMYRAYQLPAGEVDYGPTINIEQQIDNSDTITSSVVNTEYLDNYNMWLW